jgi:hypothetical protein
VRDAWESASNRPKKLANNTEHSSFGCTFGATSFCLLDILPSHHFVCLTSYLLIILSTCHFTYSSFCLLDILPAYHFFYMAFYLPIILSPWYFPYSSFCLLDILFNGHFVNLTFYILNILSTWHFTYSSFCLLGILPTHLFVYLAFYLFVILPAHNIVHLAICLLIMLFTCQFICFVILATSHFTYLYCLLDILPPYHFVNFTFYLLVTLSTWHLAGSSFSHPETVLPLERSWFWWKMGTSLFRQVDVMPHVLTSKWMKRQADKVASWCKH